MWFKSKLLLLLLLFAVIPLHFRSKKTTRFVSELSLFSLLYWTEPLFDKKVTDLARALIRTFVKM